MTNTTNCQLCGGQMGIYVTCSKCQQTIERICIKCINPQRIPCGCFELQNSLLVDWGR